MDQLKNNLEFASSMGRVWEHQFCSARVTINFLLKTHDGNLTDESLQTLLVAVEAVVNLHPLKLEAINDRKKSNFTWSNKPFHNKMECHHYMSFHLQIHTAKEIEGENNIFVMNFGTGGGKRCYLVFHMVLME